jgi:hypothetical protein
VIGHRKIYISCAQGWISVQCLFNQYLNCLQPSKITDYFGGPSERPCRFPYRSCTELPWKTSSHAWFTPCD